MADDTLVKKRITEYEETATMSTLRSDDVMYVDGQTLGTRKMSLLPILNNLFKSSGISVTDANYSTTITDVNSQPVNTIYTYAANLQSKVSNLPSNFAVTILHYTPIFQASTAPGQVMLAIERTGDNKSLYFRTTSGSPAAWSAWQKVTNGSDVEAAIRQELDVTLSISGKLADAKAAGDAIDEVKADFENNFNMLGNAYNNIINGHENIVEVNISSGTATTALGNITQLENGKTYYYYVEFTVSNLSSWTSGYIYFRGLHSMSTPGWADHYIKTIKNNNTYHIGYNFTANQSGTIIPQLFFNYAQPSTNSFNITVNKLFCIESADDLVDVCNKSHDGKMVFAPDITKETLSKELQESFVYTDLEAIDCWGDSLTLGIGSTDGNTYPKYLQDFLGNEYTVTNYGHGGETAVAIALRQGALGMVIDPFSVENDGRATVTFIANNGMSLQTLYSNSNGTEGIDYIHTLANGAETSFMFRTTSNANEGTLFNYTGAAQTFDRPILATSDGAKNTHRMLIICIGQNGYGYGIPAKDHADDMIHLIGSMIEHNGGNKYIIISPPTNNAEFWADYEASLGSAFGQNYLNAREYISKYGLSDNNLTPTSEDEAAMEIGAIPPQLLNNDPVHFTNAGYYSLAKCIYQRGQQLGYWE